METELKQLRLLKGFTLEQVAKRGGISTTYLNSIENGYQLHPSLDMVEKIAIGLNEDMVDIYYIIKRMIKRLSQT